MPGTECAQYTNGGKDPPTSCTSDILKPQSLYAKSEDDGGSCSFYSDENCNQDVVNVGGKCLDASFLPPKKIGSFKCRVGLEIRYFLTGLTKEHRVSQSRKIARYPSHECLCKTARVFSDR